MFTEAREPGTLATFFLARVPQLRNSPQRLFRGLVDELASEVSRKRGQASQERGRYRSVGGGRWDAGPYQAMLVEDRRPSDDTKKGG